MMRMNRLAAMCLALVGSISATVALAGTNVTATSTPPSSAGLSQLAAEMAATSARLAELQEAYSSAKKISATDESRTTVHWLGSNSSQLSSNARIDIEIAPAMAMDVVETSAIAPRPAAIAYRQAPIALAAPTTSTIVHAQANEEVFYTAQAIQNLDSAAQDEFSPQPSQMPWGDPVFASDGCCDTCCSPGNCCPKCRPRCILVVSTEAVFVSPDVNGVPVSYRYYEAGNPPQVLQFGPDFDDAALDNFYIAPRISLGWQGECWGVVGRYYHLRAAEHAHDPLVPTGQFAYHSFDMNNILEAYYTDIELTRNFCLHGCKNQFAFGCRYALISHDESIYGRAVVDFDNPSILQGGARRNRQAHGTGLTVALNGRKPLFCNSCAHWFYNVRTSILWGSNQSEVESWADVTAISPATVADAGSVNTATAVVVDDLFIGEIQVGIEWDFALRCLPAKAFFRTAFEYQYWDASTGLAASGSFAGLSTGGDAYQVTTGSSAPGLIVDFVGLSIGTGFTW